MSLKPKRFPSNALVPSSGEIYCHIFENRNTGLDRNLFWSITVDFQPFLHEDVEFSCSTTCEWIAWPLRDWKELDQRQLDVDYGENGIESSFYMSRHDIATHTKLSLRQKQNNVFRVSLDMVVEFLGYFGGDEDHAMPIHAEVDVPFIGLLVIPDNLFPKPSSPNDLRKVASQFVDLSAYEGPEPWKSHGFIFRPVGVTQA